MLTSSNQIHIKTTRVSLHYIFVVNYTPCLVVNCNLLLSCSFQESNKVHWQDSIRSGMAYFLFRASCFVKKLVTCTFIFAMFNMCLKWDCSSTIHWNKHYFDSRENNQLPWFKNFLYLFTTSWRTRFYISYRSLLRFALKAYYLKSIAITLSKQGAWLCILFPNVACIICFSD